MSGGTVALVSPRGAKVTVAESAAATMVAVGYRPVENPKPAPKRATAKK